MKVQVEIPDEVLGEAASLWEAELRKAQVTVRRLERKIKSQEATVAEATEIKTKYREFRNYLKENFDLYNAYDDYGD